MLGAILLAAAFSQGARPPPPAPEPPPPATTPAPVATGEAIAYFRRTCVDTLPDPSAFALRFDLASGIWTAYEKRDPNPSVRGSYWRSAQGEVGYVYRPGTRRSGPSPACEYAFLTAPDFGFDAAASALASALGLGAGRRAGTAIRWESRLPNGTEARLTLSAAEDMGGPAARLSIFAYRLPANRE
jgi:hypothetical protein